MVMKYNDIINIQHTQGSIMAIKFYCKCGKKVSVPEEERNMEGECPGCGEMISLKDADPTTIEREPMAVIDIDSSDPGSETNEFGAVPKEEKVRVDEKGGTPEINPAKGTRSERRTRRTTSRYSDPNDTDRFNAESIRSDVEKSGDTGADDDNDQTQGLEPVDDPETEEWSETGSEQGDFRQIETEALDEGEFAEARLLIIMPETGRRRPYILKKDITVIGRSEEADITLQQRGVSQKHCRIIKKNSEYFIQDMGSTNGVRVNGRKIERTVLLKGDKILLGKAQLYFMI